METAPEDPRHVYLEEMASAVERAKELTSQLMNFCQKKQDSPMAIRLGGVLLDFRKMLRRIIGENIELVTNIEEDSGWVMVNPRQIETVVLNLVVNACEAMPHGGRLSIDLVEQARFLQIVVSDTGVGMEKTFLDRIFKPTGTSGAQESAPVLGLPTCLAIVEQIGGKITAKSTPGKGSTFRISLPRIASPITDGPKGALPKKNAVSSGNGEKILIVEDDASAQGTVAALVRGMGYHVICAANGDEAQRILERKSEIRLVICDIVMPLMGGTELTKVIHHRWPGVKILLTSGYASAPFEKSPPILNHTAFLPKPLSRGVLAGKIRELLNA